MLIVTNPATEKVLQEIPEDDAASIKIKFARALEAQHRWFQEPLVKRQEVIAKFAKALSANVNRLADILSAEMGKPVVQARNEVNATPARLQFFLDHVPSVVRPERVFQDGSMVEEIRYEPLGVIGNISAWNYPYFVGTNVIVPALLTGNAVLYKPSEYATLTGLALVDLFVACGLPQDVLIPIVGRGDVGAELLKQPLAGIFFTGSYATGQKIAAAAAKGLMKVQLELGGKDAAYISNDVDVAKVASSVADGAFYNTGQSCCAVERIYVHQDIAEQFTEEFVKNVRGFCMGLPSDEKTYIGPLARKEQVLVLEQQVKNAVAQGARLLCGGKPKKPGYYFEATVLSHVHSGMLVMREESFGPIIGLQTVVDDTEATSHMNESEYGLTASVYCRDLSRAEKILNNIQTGTVYLNCCDRVSPRLPWSGRKHSGLGVTLSLEGLRTFLQPKAWHMRSVDGEWR